MQFLATVLALAALSSASPFIHHRHVHQKRNPMPRPEFMEALAATYHGDSASASTAAATATATPSVSPAQAAQKAVVAPSPVTTAAAVPTVAAAAAPAAAPAVNVKIPAVANVADISSIVGVLSRVSCQKGINAQANNGAIWIGSDGDYTNTFTNAAGVDIAVVVWAEKSWVNAFQPHITVALPAGSSVTVSFANGMSGGWTGVYPNTNSLNGQIKETWGEFTFKAPFSTVDVSREVNMQGHAMSINTPGCVSDMNTCVFVCEKSNDSCMFDYKLKNCAPGSQPGANYGQSFGADSGGCTFSDSKAHITTTFS